MDMNLIKLLVLFIVFQVGRVLFSVVVYFCWILNGTYKSDRQRSRPENYETSAHVLDIWARYKLDVVVEPTARCHFWLTHNHFEHPEVVLKDNITLCNITDKEAIFVEVDESVDVTRMDINGFVCAAQFLLAKRIVVMPISSFNKLSKRVGDPKGKLIYLASHSRSGSNLMTQFFEDTDNCMCFSEHEVFTSLAFSQLKGASEETLQELLSSCVRLLCKPRSDKTYAGYVFKPRPPSSLHCFPLMKRVFPRTYSLFLYRNGLDSILSVRAISYTLPIWHLLTATASISPAVCLFFHEWSQFCWTDKAWFAPGTVLTKSALLWVTSCSEYNKLIDEGLAIRAIKYEDFLRIPDKAAVEIMRYVDFPEEWAKDGLRAFKKDSQRQSVLSREKMAKYRSQIITPEEEKVINDFVARYGTPKMREECVLEGTLTR